MHILFSIRLFYILFVFYVLLVIGSTSISFINIYPSIIILLINYMAFHVGYISIKGKTMTSMLDINEKYSLHHLKPIHLYLLMLLALVFSIYVVKYYTSQSPYDVYNNLHNGISTYYVYQNYFKESNLAVFSLSKLPYVFMMFYIKFMLFYSYISLVLIKNKINKHDILYLCGITIAFIYVGISRGTNFEFFELALVVIFILLQKSFNMRKLIKNVFLIFALIFLMICIFYIVISARGVEFSYYISSDVFYDENSVVSYFLKPISLLVIIIYNYFGFGFYYISKFVEEVWLLSVDNFINGLVPLGFSIFKESSIQDIMKEIIDMGVRWHPDTILIINNFGYLGLLMFCYILGLLSKVLVVNEKNAITLLSLLMIFITMISLPVGNFILSSSASKIIVCLLILFGLINFILKQKRKKYVQK